MSQIRLTLPKRRSPQRHPIIPCPVSYGVGLMILAACVVMSPGTAEEIEATCDKGRLFRLSRKPADGLQYAPDRNVDILHVSIEATPDFEKRTIAGTTTIRFAPIALALDELRLDGVDLTVHRAESSAELAAYQVTADQVIFTFADPVPAGRETTVTIEHEAEPGRGFYFRTPEMGYPAGNDHFFTQGQPFMARHWYPNFDSPNEKFTSEVTCRVPEGMTVISNGRLVSQTKDEDTGRVAFRWLQDKPHPNYLIAVCAGYFEKIEDDHHGLPLAFYTPPAHFEHAANSFRATKEMMAFFEEEIGVPYPWDKYDQVVVDDFIAGGMENTSLTVLTTRTLFPDEIENVRNSEPLVAHELAHQWFGDYVTCKDWSHIWLNEGFASYYDRLFHGHRHGADSMRYRLLQDLEMITTREDSPLPIVNKRYESAMHVFTYRAYQKGSWVLHMLRSQLGEDLYRRCIRTYVERHALGNVVTEDLNRVVEELSGRSFDRFFDQWIYHAHHPELEVTHEWQARKKLAKVSVKQTQAVSEQVYLFNFPLKLRFMTDSGTVDHAVEVTDARHDFYVPMTEEPRIVRFDPKLTLLAKITFDKPNAMLHAQLKREDDAIGRVLACRALAKKDDKQTVAELKQALNADPFYGVRIAASQALREIKSKEAFEALAESTEQPDARVRRRVAEDLVSFYREEAFEAANGMLAAEKNPEVLAAGLRGVGKYHAEPALRDLLLENLKSNSFHEIRAVAALVAIRLLDDPAYIKPVMTTLKDREREFTTHGFTAGLDALAYVARNEDDKSTVRDFIAAYVNHKKEGLQTGALKALGALKDPSAIGIIDSFIGDDDEDGVQQAAEAASKSLHEIKKVPVELSDLRGEMLDLKKQTESLKEQIDDLENQLDAEKKSGRKKFLGIF